MHRPKHYSAPMKVRLNAPIPLAIWPNLQRVPQDPAASATQRGQLHKGYRSPWPVNRAKEVKEQAKKPRDVTTDERTDEHRFANEDCKRQGGGTPHIFCNCSF